jgi:general secretion pathway protein E
MLRQDPDVILVGEIRDEETAVTAVQAALTGHFVFSSIHANDTMGMISRLIDFGVEPALASSTLIALVAQRMVRRICPNCRTPAAPTAAEQNIYRREMGQELPLVYKGAGCHLCANTGYRGRIGVFELLEVTEGIQKKLISHSVIGELREQALRDGMCTMKQDGLIKVKEGLTSFEEIMSGVFTLG